MRFVIQLKKTPVWFFGRRNFWKNWKMIRNRKSNLLSRHYTCLLVVSPKSNQNQFRKSWLSCGFKLDRNSVFIRRTTFQTIENPLLKASVSFGSHWEDKHSYYLCWRYSNRWKWKARQCVVWGVKMEPWTWKLKKTMSRLWDQRTASISFAETLPLTRW